MTAKVPPTTGLYSTPRQFGAEIGVSEVTLSQWRRAGKGPAYLRIAANKVRYARADIETWLASIRKAG